MADAARRRPKERRDPEAGIEPVVIFERVVLLVLGALQQSIESHGQFALDDLFVEIEGAAIRLVAAVAGLDAKRILEPRPLQGTVDDARRAAGAEENGVGATVYLDAVDVVAVERDRGVVEIMRFRWPSRDSPTTRGGFRPGDGSRR